LIQIEFKPRLGIKKANQQTSLMTINPARIQAYDHVGIRVTDRDVAIPFYESLGFRQTDYFRDHQANEMQTADGVRINLIFNAAKRPANSNILLDEPVKLAGVTHPAFVVDNLAAFQRWLEQAGIQITEGPAAIGPRRIALFIRDPDGNVLEFDQLL
jgi:lactoylglutathione lyase